MSTTSNEPASKPAKPKRGRKPKVKPESAVPVVPSVDQLLAQTDEPAPQPVSAPTPATEPIKIERLVELVEQRDAVLQRGRECYQEADDIAEAIRNKLGLGEFPLPDGRIVQMWDPFVDPQTGDEKKHFRMASCSRYEFKVKDAPKRKAKITI